MKKNISLFLIALCWIFSGSAQDDAAELAKKLANPISSLISLPFQNNSDYGIGELKGSRNTMNIQPVVPFSVSPKLNLITRIIMPITTQYNITGIGEKQSGLSDFVLSGFLSPKESGNGITWGAGPVFLLPVGNDYFGSGSFGVGPTAVALKQTKGWTFGALVNQVWSITESDSKPDVNQMFLQPFLVHNWKSGAGLGVNMEYTENWQAKSSTIFLNPFVNGVTSIGKQKIQLGVGPRINLAAPGDNTSSWGWRAVLVLLFTK